MDDLELLADEKFSDLQGDLLGTLQWDPLPVYDAQRMHTEDAKYFCSEPIGVQMPANGSSSASSSDMNPNMLLQDYLTSDGGQNGGNHIYFHPGMPPPSVYNSSNDVSPSAQSYLQGDEEPSSVRPPKSRDRARHREVEQKYRNRINSKMDELCALLTPDGKPQMQKWTALDNAIKLIKYLRRQNEFLRNDSANLRAQVYTLQCALNRSMGVDFVPNTAYPPEQPWPMQPHAPRMPGSHCSTSSPNPSPSSGSDDIPVQKARINVVPGPSPPNYSPPSPSSSSFSDGSIGPNGIPRVSPNFLQQQPPANVKQQGGVTIKKVNVRPTATAAAIPQGRTVLACVLFSVLFFWNPFITNQQNEDIGMSGHQGHDHKLERVFDSGAESGSFADSFQWITSTYIIAGLLHLLLFAWLVVRLFVLPEVMLTGGSESETDIEADVKQHVRFAHDHIANGHYSVAFEELSAACSIMGHPLPQTSLDVVLSFFWAAFRQLGHMYRIGIAITIWIVQFLADGPLQPTILHRRLTTCASIQQRIVKLAASGKIDLPVFTRLALSLSSISLQEIAYSLATTGCNDRHWHHLLEDSYITAGIAILQLPLPVCFFARYYFFQASSTAKLFGSVGEHRRFGWLYGLESSALKDLISVSLHADDCQSQSVIFDDDKATNKRAVLKEPWSTVAWLRSRDLLTELLSCLTLSVPASSSSSIPKALRSRPVDSISEYCLGELEQIENCLRSGASTTSRFGSWLKLLRGCQAWRRADQEVLNTVVESMMKDNKKEDANNAYNATPTEQALQFALVASSLLPHMNTRYQTIQRLLRAASALLENNLHENPDDVILQLCRLMAAEITLSCRLHLIGRQGDKRADLSHAESCMTVYLVLLDRMAPNHPRALMYRSRMALAAGENPSVAERFAKTALAVTLDSSHSRAARFSAPNLSSINLLSAEAVLLLTLIRSKFGGDKYQPEREALQQAVQSFQQENSPALAHLCSQLIGVN